MLGLQLADGVCMLRESSVYSFLTISSRLMPVTKRNRKKILELTYAQAIIWFGSFFCPLLPVAGILRVFVLFYIQKFSTLRFCQPKGTPFQAKHSLPWLIWICFAIHLMMAALHGARFPTEIYTR
jgi:hypothetical protein